MALQDAAAEKVILNGETIIDVTETTATEEAVFSGRTFLGADGKAVTGTLKLPLQIVDDSGYLSLNKDKNTIYARYQSGTDVDSINPVLFNRAPKINEVFYALIRTNDDIYLPCYCQCTGVISGNNYWTFKIIHLVAPDLTVQLSNKDLNNYTNIGQFYFGAGGNACTNIPEGIDAFGMFVIRTAYGYYCQILISGNTPEQKIYTRTQRNVEGNLSWTEWICQTGTLILEYVVEFGVSYNEINKSDYGNSIPYTSFSRYPILGDTFVLIGISLDKVVFMCKAIVTIPKNSSNNTAFKIENGSCTILYDPSGFDNRIKDLENNKANYATKTEAQSYATTTENNAKVYADSLAGNYDEKGSAAQALTDAKAYTNEVKEALLGTEELNGTYDTLKEIGAWIENSGVDATELSGAIAKEAKAREDADADLMSEIEDEVSARKQADTDLENTLIEKINESKTLLGQDITAAKTASENYTDTELTNLYNTVQQDIAGAINSQTEWTNNQLQSLYDDVLGISGADATAKANTAETNANAYTDQKIEDLSIEDINIVVDSELTPYSDSAVSSKGIMQRYYNVQTSDFAFNSFNALFHSVYNNTHTYELGNTVIFNNAKGRFKCLVIEAVNASEPTYHPTASDMLFGNYEDLDYSLGTTFQLTTNDYQEYKEVYMQTIQKLDYYTQEEIDTKLETASEVSGEAPDKDKLVTSGVVNDAFNTLVGEVIPKSYYNKTEIDAIFEPASEGAVIRDANGDVIVPESPSSANAAISQTYLSSQLSSINSAISSIQNVNATQTTQIGKMSSSYTLSGFYSWFQVARNCGGAEIIPASPPTSPYDFIFLPTANTFIYYKGMIRIFYDPRNTVYFVLGNKCDQTGAIIEEDSRIVIQPTAIENINGGEMGFAVTRAFYYQ